MTLRAPVSLAIIFAVPVLLATLARSQDAPPPTTLAPGQNLGADTGEYLYRTYCAVCHGPNARGDGQLAEHLRVRPADLTRLAKRNGGKFDADKVAKAIDGREDVKGHGDSDMPVWGDALKRTVERFSEKAVKARIDRLAEYLGGQQVK